MSFLGLVRCVLPVDLNEPPPLWFACLSQRASFFFLLLVLLFQKVLSFYDDRCRWDIGDRGIDRWTEGEIKRERGESEKLRE